MCKRSFLFSLLISMVLFCVGSSADVYAQRFRMKAQPVTAPERKDNQQKTLAQRWVDSVFASLSQDEKIAQLMVIRAHSNLGPDHVQSVTELIKKYNVGGLCFFQGGPVRQAILTNYYQSIAPTPLLICIDGEWGLGMRLDSVINLPRQLMLGAVNDADIVYNYGKLIGEQCLRMGIHVNYAPVVDINNNAANPVINDRSFGEDKYKVALYGVQYMRGMQDLGVMGCAKHFPGHGDVTVDSHHELPVITKSRKELDSLELYPFRKMFEAGVGSVMIAHLYIPAIDNTAHLASSLSYKNVTDLLRKDMGYQGLSFTDALEMKGVTKYFPAGEAALQSLIAGNDMLCLPEDVEGSIKLIKKAIKKNSLTWTDLDARVRKVLTAKYHAGLAAPQPIKIENLAEDINKDVLAMRQEVADHAITLVRDDTRELPLIQNPKTTIAYVGVGIDAHNTFSTKLKEEYEADTYFFNYNQDLSRVASLAAMLKKKYTQVIIGIHNISRRPAKDYGMSLSAQKLVQALHTDASAITVVFGNPYAIGFFPEATTLLACYEDDAITQETAFDIIAGKKEAAGTLPVTVATDIPFGTGVLHYLQHIGVAAEENKLHSEHIDTIHQIMDAVLYEKVTPGAVVLAAQNGKVIFESAYGFQDYTRQQAMRPETIFDLASITKVAATNLAIMKLFEEGKINLQKTLDNYLPMVSGTNKASIKLEDLLMHQAGLPASISFYKATIDPVTGLPKPGYYHPQSDSSHAIPVAEGMFLRNTYVDTVWMEIMQSPVGPSGKYLYSDIGFLLLGKLVESLTGTDLDQYLQKTFYAPMALSSTDFEPFLRFPLSHIAPTAMDNNFRKQQIRGYVHDEAAAMLGGIAGNAGLFSNVQDLWALFQMLLNGGEYNGRRYLKKETIDLFTSYGTANSRRALGFDKPEKDNDSRSRAYPSLLASPFAYGHNGFTGTCVWVDPACNLVYIFLSNRVFPDGNDNRLNKDNIRGRILDQVYKLIGVQ